MKKKILILMISLGLIWGIAFAAPGDVILTIVIPAAKVADFQAGFLEMFPVPLIEDPNWSDANEPIPIIPQFTQKEWVEEWLKRQLIWAYRNGKYKLAQQAVQIDEDIIN